MKRVNRQFKKEARKLNKIAKKYTKRIMNKSQRKLLLIEFEQFLSQNFEKWGKEVKFRDIMVTDRNFRADYCIYPNIIIEINGGQWQQGRHNRGARISKKNPTTQYEMDLQKSNLANLGGFYYLQHTYEMLKTGGYKNDLRGINANKN